MLVFQSCFPPRSVTADFRLDLPCAIFDIGSTQKNPAFSQLSDPFFAHFLRCENDYHAFCCPNAAQNDGYFTH